MNENPVVPISQKPTRQYDYSALSMHIGDETIKEYLRQNSQISALLKGTPARIAAGLGLLFLVVSTVTIAVANSGGNGILIVFILVVVALVVFGAVRLILKSRRADAERIIRINTFAENNGFIFGRDVRMESDPGMFFSVGDTRVAYELMRTNDTDEPYLFGNYSYFTGSGKNRSEYKLGFVRIRLDRDLPQIVLDGQQNNSRILGMEISNLPVDFKKNQRMNLEGDFNQYFQLYAPINYETDALYIFTPDLMALFIDHAAVFDAEIVDHWLYVYMPIIDLTNGEILQRIFSIVDTVGAKTIRQTDRYQDERAIRSQGETIAAGGRRLRKGVSWLTIVIVVGVIGFNVFPFVIDIIDAISKLFKP